MTILCMFVQFQFFYQSSQENILKNSTTIKELLYMMSIDFLPPSLLSFVSFHENMRQILYFQEIDRGRIGMEKQVVNVTQHGFCRMLYRTEFSFLFLLYTSVEFL